MLFPSFPTPIPTPCPQHKHTGTCRHGAAQHSLPIAYTKPHTSTLGLICPFQHIFLSPGCESPAPEDQCKHHISNTTSPDPHISAGPRYQQLWALQKFKADPVTTGAPPTHPAFPQCRQQVSLHTQTSAYLVKMCHSGGRPSMAHDRLREPLLTTRLKEKAARAQQQATGNTALKYKVLGDRGHCTAGPSSSSSH